MEIKKEITGAKAVIGITGWLDTETAPMRRDELDSLPGEVSELVIDCAELEYVSSAGLRQLVSAHTKMKGAFELKNVSDEIMYVLNTTGLSKVIKTT